MWKGVRVGGPLSALSQIMLQGLPRRGSLLAGVECARSEQQTARGGSGGGNRQ